MLVFLYGTLKTGAPNHGLLLKNGRCTLKGNGVTTQKYPLVIATRYNGPFLLFKPGVGHNIEGEVYDVDEEGLAYLDSLENHPHFYERVPVEVRLTADDAEARVLTCDSYFIVQFREDLLDLPMFSCYKDNINGMKFIMPEKECAEGLPLYEVHKGYAKPK